MKVGVCLNEGDGKQCRVNSLLFADDAVLIADNEECLLRMTIEMSVAWKRVEYECMQSYESGLIWRIWGIE